jgi:hypothetical protein
VQVFRLNVIHASAIGLGACAIAALAFPAALLRGLGVVDPSVAILGVMRLAGVVLLALAAVLWSARSGSCRRSARRRLRILAVIYGISAVMLLGQQMAAGRVVESAIPIIYVSLLAYEYAGTARRYSGAGDGSVAQGAKRRGGLHIEIQHSPNGCVAGPRREGVH